MVYTRPRRARAALLASVVLCLVVVVLPTSVLARERAVVAPQANNSSKPPVTDYSPTSVVADDAREETQIAVRRCLERPHDDARHWKTRYWGDVDKAQNNPLMVHGHSAWGLIYNFRSGKQTPLPMVTDSFCAAGTFISNGEIITVGGQTSEQTELGKPGVAGDGFTSLRVFQPTTRRLLDDPSKVRIQSARWYASVIRVTDGSALIMGGSKKGQYNNEARVDNPTMEFYPSKGPQRYSQFLHDALVSNLFPIAFLLSISGNIVVIANKIAMIYDWKNDVEHRIKGPPGGIVFTYPASATAVLLPLTIKKKWLSEVLICGGVFDTVDLTTPGHNVRADKLVSDQCVRTSFPGGTKISGWQSETMPTPRIMGEGLITAGGKVFIAGGAQRGTAGYGNAIGMVGHSNAQAPVLTPVLYDPDAPSGQRFFDKFPAAQIERLYHSVLMQMTDGSFIHMGSSPNPRVLTKYMYKTRFEIELINPPYMTKKRPFIVTYPKQLNYGGRHTVAISNPRGCDNARVVLLDGGYATHGLHMNQRSAELQVTSFTNQSSITFCGPLDETIWPPGPAFLWVTVCAGNIPSHGHKIMVGDGSNPPNYKVPF